MVSLVPVCVLVALALSPDGPVPSRRPPPRPAPMPIVVYLHTYGRTIDFDLASALDRAAAAFGAAGIGIEWRHASADRWARCRLNEFTVLFLPADMTNRKAAMEGLAGDVLGSSAIAANRAWIFMDRIADVAWRGGLRESDILGQVITHELGHLVLFDGTHSANGAMRDRVTLSGAVAVRFNADQRARMRALLGAIASPDALPAAVAQAAATEAVGSRQPRSSC